MIGQISAQTSFEPASNQLRTNSEPASAMEFGLSSGVNVLKTAVFELYFSNYYVAGTRQYILLKLV